MASLDVKVLGEGPSLRLRLTVSGWGSGRAATLRLLLRARVKKPSPIHGERCLWQQPLAAGSGEIEVEIPAEALCEVYTHQGPELDIHLILSLSNGAAEALEQRLPTEGLAILQPPRRALPTAPPEAFTPADHWGVWPSLRVLPWGRRALVLLLLLALVLFWLVNPLVGLHDQYAAESQALFYDKRGKGGSESPLVKALILTVVLGLLSLGMLRAQIGRYMAFAIKPHPPLRPGLHIPLAELVEGQSRVDLSGATLRVVAGNCERGEDRSGEDRRSSFSRPFNARVLYERPLGQLPAGTPLSTVLKDEVDFSPLFKALLPPLAVGDDHGIGVVWRVLLLHPALADQKAEGSSEGLRYADFIEPPTGP